MTDAPTVAQERILKQMRNGLNLYVEFNIHLEAKSWLAQRNNSIERISVPSRTSDAMAGKGLLRVKSRTHMSITYGVAKE